MGRIEGGGERHSDKSIIDPILEWFSPGSDADGTNLPPYHIRCRCRLVPGDEGKEYVVTQPMACGLCRIMQAIHNGQQVVSTIKVEEVPEGVEPKALAKVLTHLERLAEKYPKGVPSDGIRLRLTRLPRNLHGQWRDDHRRMSLSIESFGTAKGRVELARKLTALERKNGSPPGCQTPEYVITHEFAHCLRHRLNGPKYASWWMKADRGAMGGNATKSHAEGFAEGFSMIEHVPAAKWPPNARSLYQMLQEDGVL